MRPGVWMGVAATAILLPLGLRAQGGAIAIDARGPLLNDLPTPRSGTYTVVSGTPPGFPAELLVPNGQIEGAAVTAGIQAVVSRVPDMAARQWREILRRAERAGWMSEVPPQEGFSLSPLFPDFRLCRGTETAAITMAGGRTGLLIRSFVNKTAGQQPCQPRGLRPFSDVLIPILRPPDGVSVGRLASHGGTDDKGFDARLQTSLPLREVAAGYVTQLNDAGWKTVWQSPADPTSAVTRFTGQSDTGGTLTAYLILTRMPTAPPSIAAMLQVLRDNPTVPLRQGRGRGTDVRN